MTTRNPTRLIVFALLLGSMAGSAQASLDIRQPQPDRGFTGIKVAQADGLKPSTLRRLRFYAGKVIESLTALAQEDQASTGGVLDSTTTDALRKNIERLLDAGNKAGLTLEQTAEFFKQEMLANYTGAVPLIVQDANGNLNALQLFQGVALSKANRADDAAEADYLAAVTAAGVAAQTGGASGSATSAPVLAQPATEEPTVQRDPAIQAFWDRLRTSNGKRTITVQPGDTLATYANAFYGDSLKYRVIYDANRDILDTPNMLEVGKRITIP